MKVIAFVLAAFVSAPAFATDCADLLAKYPRLADRLARMPAEQRELIAPALERDKTFCNSPDGRREPEIGMSWQQLRQSTWGGPNEVNTTRTKTGTSEQWVYRWQDKKSKYVYLENGTVTAIQD